MDGRRPTTRTKAHAAAIVLAALGAAGASMPARAFELAGGKGSSYQIPRDEVHEGDLYVAGLSVDIAGTQRGDLVVAGQTVSIPGQVDGDVIAGVNTFTLQGRVSDTVRVAANSVVVHGIVEGDLLAFAQTVTLTRGSRIDGDVVAFAQIVTVEGSVGGDVNATGQSLNVYGDVGAEISATVGELRLGGTVGRDVHVTCDTLRIEPGARIEGDLVYKARKPLEDLDEERVVGGKVEFEEKVETEGDDEGGGFSLWWVLWRLVLFGASMLLGSVLIALFRRQATASVDAIEREPLMSLGVGFVLAIPLPVAALISCVLLITIPLAGITLLLVAVAWYVAKIPVAIWIGSRLLRWVGSREPSPFLGLLIGLVVLTALFQIPCLKLLVYCAAVFFGLGAMFLGVRSQEPAGRASDAPPSSPETAPAG